MKALVAVVLLFGCAANLLQAEPYEFGIEQEMRSNIQYLSVAPAFIPIFGWFGRRDAKKMDLVSTITKSAYLRALREEAKNRNGEMVVEGDRVFYPKLNWGFNVDTDFTTLEIALEPFTIDKIREARAMLKRDLFEIPAKMGIHPRPGLGGGHMHIGLKNFNNDPKFFMNYIIDYVNHSELANGAFLYEPMNASPVVQDKASREGFKKLIEDFDAGKVKTIPEIQDRLVALGFSKLAGQVQGALNAKTKYPTIEMRASRTHETVDHLIDFAELQAKRLDYIKEKKERIPFLDVGPIRSVGQGVAQYRQYLEEMGADYERFKKLIPPSWRKAEPDYENAFKPNDKPLRLGLKCRLLFRDILHGTLY